MRRIFSVGVVLGFSSLSLSACNCGGGEGPVDAGVDAGKVGDSGVVDAGVDAGVPDAGPADSGVVDSGVVDAGVDAGAVDAGAVDAGVDAGTAGDGGLVFESISAGVVSACGVTTTHAAYCWGQNSSALLGTGDFMNSPTPKAVVGGQSFAMVSVGNPIACGVTTGGDIYCWGTNTMGTGGWGPTPTFSFTPVLVPSTYKFKSVSAGAYHACGLTLDGGALCWGDDSNGGLGDNMPNATSNVPVPVSGGLTFASVEAGGSWSCGLTPAGAAWCWGGNGYGMLGIGSFVANTLVPAPVDGGMTFTAITPGTADHTCALTATGEAWCWGFNGNSELGIAGGAVASPVPVSGGFKFKQIVAGDAHSCGVTLDGGAYCWGDGSSGDLGNNDVQDSALPVPVSGALRFESITAGSQVSCGITTGHVAYCWGKSTNGLLGDGLGVDSHVPSRVAGQ